MNKFHSMITYSKELKQIYIYSIACILLLGLLNSIYDYKSFNYSFTELVFWIETSLGACLRPQSFNIRLITKLQTQTSENSFKFTCIIAYSVIGDPAERVKWQNMFPVSCWDSIFRRTSEFKILFDQFFNNFLLCDVFQINSGISFLKKIEQ